MVADACEFEMATEVVCEYIGIDYERVGEGLSF